MEITNPQLTIDWLRANYTGDGITVAVIDSGVDARHPDLADKVVRAGIVQKNDEGIIVREIPPRESFDSYGHGSAVAGAIATLAPEAKIASVKVLNEYNQCTGNELITGLQWSLDQRFKLINMSLATSKKMYAARLLELCEQAYVQETILVASKRNFGDLGLPAMFSNVISIDREDFDDPFQLKHLPRGLIEFAAHGTNVMLPALDGGYAVQTGTSFAAPHVAGIVALLLEAYPDLLPWEAKTILKSLAFRASA
jgi:subtilisin family serine protease